MSKTFERRMAVTGFEFREASDELTLTGYASVYDAPYSMGWYTETVKPGAFKRSLGTKPDVTLLVNHAGLPLARTISGTLTLDGDDPYGLGVRASLDPSDPDVQAIAPKMRRGDLSQMSFAFGVMSDDGEEWSGDMKQRTMRNLEINKGDVSVVTHGASPTTSSSIRSDGPSVEAMASALRTLETRGASALDMAELLDRARAYFRGAPVAAVEPDGDETTCGGCDGDCCDCTDPDCDGTCCDACPGKPAAAKKMPMAMNSAVVAHELRLRLLRLAG